MPISKISRLTNVQQWMEKTNEIIDNITGIDIGQVTQNTRLDTIDSGQTTQNNRLTAIETPSVLLSKIKSVDGSGSGLDADLLDGQSSAYYQRNLSDITNFGISQNVGGDKTTSIDFNSHGAIGEFDFSTRISRNAGSNGKFVISHIGTGNFEINTGGGDVTINANEVWHAGNHGTGSGLDADLLDGLDSTSYLRRDIAQTILGNFTVSGTSPSFAFLETDTNANARLLVSSGQIYVQASSNDGTDSGGIINFTGIGTTDLGEVRIKTDGVYNKVWHAGNDGISSGLDADLLDGQHISYLQRNFEDIGSVNLGAQLSGDRNIFMDFVADGAAGATNYSTRLIRNGGANGTFDIVQLGTGFIRIAASAGVLINNNRVLTVADNRLENDFTAVANVLTAPSSGNNRTMTVLASTISNTEFSFDDSTPGSNLRPAAATGFSGGPLSGTWRCHGRTGTGAGVEERTTTWFRIA